MRSRLGQYRHDIQVLQGILKKHFRIGSFIGAVAALFNSKGRVTNLKFELKESRVLAEQSNDILVQTLEELWDSRAIFGHPEASSVQIVSLFDCLDVFWAPQNPALSDVSPVQLKMIIQPIALERENDIEVLARGIDEVGYIHAHTISSPTKNVQIMVQERSATMQRLSDEIEGRIRCKALIEICASEWTYSDELFFCTGVEITPLAIAVDDYYRIFQEEQK